MDKSNLVEVTKETVDTQMNSKFIILLKTFFMIVAYPMPAFGKG